MFLSLYNTQGKSSRQWHIQNTESLEKGQITWQTIPKTKRTSKGQRKPVMQNPRSQDDQQQRTEQGEEDNSTGGNNQQIRGSVKYGNCKLKWQTGNE